jgi:phosphoribosylanthranilate isomerase
VEYAGMIFYEKSVRYADDKLKDQKEEIKHCAIRKVGVFVNADLQTIRAAIADYGLSAVQLHGDESAMLCKALMEDVHVIKVFRIGEEQDIDDLVMAFDDACHYYLFDTDTKAYGGSGKQFDWSMLEKAQINKSFFLSGGIGPDDVEKIKAFKHPCLYAIDVNSRFETEPGIKDMDLLKQFISDLNPAVVSDTTKEN